MTEPIEKLREKLRKAAKKIADFTRTERRMANWRKRQIKGAKNSMGKKRSEAHKEAISEGNTGRKRDEATREKQRKSQQKRRAIERGEK
jgi:hypothetical protein